MDSMTWNIGIILVAYYVFIGVMFFGVTTLGISHDATAPDVASIAPNPLTIIVDLGIFLVAGVGLPTATPAFIQVIFAVFQSCITLLSILLILSVTGII
jgi:hypothetical protein